MTLRAGCLLMQGFANAEADSLRRDSTQRSKHTMMRTSFGQPSTSSVNDSKLFCLLPKHHTANFVQLSPTVQAWHTANIKQ